MYPYSTVRPRPLSLCCHFAVTLLSLCCCSPFSFFFCKIVIRSSLLSCTNRVASRRTPSTEITSYLYDFNPLSVFWVFFLVFFGFTKPHVMVVSSMLRASWRIEDGRRLVPRPAHEHTSTRADQTRRPAETAFDAGNLAYTAKGWCSWDFCITHMRECVTDWLMHTYASSGLAEEEQKENK